jgi:hypothetical protein
MTLYRVTLATLNLLLRLKVSNFREATDILS